MHKLKQSCLLILCLNDPRDDICVKLFYAYSSKKEHHYIKQNST